MAETLDMPRLRRAYVWSRRRLSLPVLFLAIGLFLCLPGSSPTNAQGGPPAVRLVHASPDAPSIDATLDGQRLAEALTFEAASKSIPFPGGVARLRILSAEDRSRVLLDTPVDLPLDGPATILLTGLVSGTPALSTLVLADHLGQTSQDRSRLRFVNVAIGSGAVTLRSGESTRLFEGIGYGAMGDAVLDPGTLFLRATPSEQGASPLGELRLTAEPGRSYTIILAGQVGSDQPLKLLVLDHSRATPAGSASGGPATAGTVLVDETFTDPATGLLPATAPPNASLIYGYADGAYSLRNLEVATQSLAVPVSAPNATIAADVRLIGETTRRTVSVGCRFASDSTGNRGYRLRVEPAAGVFRLVREDGIRDTFLRRDSRSPAIRGGTDINRLELTCAGSTITAAINGTVVASVQDSTYTTGSLVIGVGARASGLTSEARFDNLVVTAR